MIQPAGLRGEGRTPGTRRLDLRAPDPDSNGYFAPPRGARAMPPQTSAPPAPPIPAPAVNSYAEVPYETPPSAQPPPSRLHVVAPLFGPPPPPVEKCRVLELGAAAGG